MRAEDVRFESDENGWEMLVTTEDGFVRRYNIHGIAFDVLKNMNDTIGDWYREGLAAAVELPTDRDLEHGAEVAWALGLDADYDLGRDIARGK